MSAYCLPFLIFSDPLPETQNFLFGLKYKLVPYPLYCELRDTLTLSPPVMAYVCSTGLLLVYTDVVYTKSNDL